MKKLLSAATYQLSFFVTANILVLWLMSLFLVIVEIELFRSYWRKRWPCFGPQASLVTSGVCQLAIAFQIFGALSGPMSKSIVGIKFNAFDLAAAITATIIGSANILTSIALRQKYRDIPIKDIRRKGLYLARMNFDLSRTNSHPENQKFQRMSSMHDLEHQPSQERSNPGNNESEFAERIQNGRADVEIEPSTYSIPTYYYRDTARTGARQPESVKVPDRSKRWGGRLAIPLGGCAG
ncbi:hypothetical protein TWF730_003443 [Orbilia blumenaviensis]|uniref:DUF7598 domain-containing protein n=1 Tax=Orbilia blumenaviensis TaxID=1796055 RepID=A0AAV9U6C6_9PEZI